MNDYIDNPKSRYIVTATEVFAQKGYNAASLSSIADKLNVTKQALLHFFGSKAKLYEEVLKALAKRLLASIKAAQGTLPEERLHNFFLYLFEESLANPDDTQLILRALLDAQTTSQTWPLKSFLEALETLARETTRWSDADQAEVFCWIYQLIGLVQHFVVSQNALKGMYGEQVFAVLAKAHKARLVTTLAELEIEPV